MNALRHALAATVQTLLRPLVRILLRHGMSFGEFSEHAKQVFVEVAEADFKLPGRKQTDSRIAVITGLNRKDVKIVRERDPVSCAEASRRTNRAARVINGWVHDARFLDAMGKPAILPFDGEGANFTQLVTNYAGDVPIRATLDEMVRVGSVKWLEDGRMQLLQPAYVPNSSMEDKLALLGIDVALLIQTIEHNLNAEQTELYYQRKVAYNNLPEDVIPLLHEKAAAQSQALLEALNAWLMEQDRDSNPTVKGCGRKHAGVGIYFFAQDYEEK